MSQETTYHHGDLRAALINAAIEAIARGGVEALSLRALAREIGVSHAAPVRHFSNKAALLTAIAREGVEALVAEAKSHAASPGLSALDRLIALASGYVAWARANPVHHSVLRNQDVMRHADRALLDDLRDYARLQRAAIVAAQAQGWRAHEPPDGILLQIVAFTAGLAIVATDPIYRAPFGAQLDEPSLDQAIRGFFRR